MAKGIAYLSRFDNNKRIESKFVVIVIVVNKNSLSYKRSGLLIMKLSIMNKPYGPNLTTYIGFVLS